MKKHNLMMALPLATLVLAQPRGGPGDGAEGPLKQLNLEPQQQEQIFQWRTEFQFQAIDLRADLQKLQLKLRDQMRRDKPNTRAINGTVDEMSAKQGALHKLRVNQRLKVRALLTPEQRQTFDSRPMGHHGGGFGDHHAQRGRQRRWRW